MHKTYTDQQLKANRDYLIGNLAKCRQVGWLTQMKDTWTELLALVEQEMRARKIEVLTIRPL